MRLGQLLGGVAGVLGEVVVVGVGLAKDEGVGSLGALCLRQRRDLPGKGRLVVGLVLGQLVLDRLGLDGVHAVLLLGSGQTLLERILHKGETWKSTDQRGLRLSTGNAGDTIVSIDGVTWPSLGSTGGVQHDLPLDAALLSIALLQTRKTKRPANERPANSKALPAASKPTAAASR